MKEEQNVISEKEDVSFFKTSAMLFAFIGLIAGVATAAFILLKKIRKAMAQVDIDADLDQFDEEETDAE